MLFGLSGVRDETLDLEKMIVDENYVAQSEGN